MPGVNAGRSGHSWRVLSARIKRESAAAKTNCWRCRQPIDYDLPYTDMESFTVGHIQPRSTHPHLAEEPLNLAAEHRRCNLAAGNRAPSSSLGTPSEVW